MSAYTPELHRTINQWCAAGMPFEEMVKASGVKPKALRALMVEIGLTPPEGVKPMPARVILTPWSLFTKASQRGQVECEKPLRVSVDGNIVGAVTSMRFADGEIVLQVGS